MSFSVKKLAESLETMTVQEREVAETKLLADYARHAAFMRPIASAGFSKIFAVSPGLEEESLAGDTDMVSIHTQDEFVDALQQRDKPLLLIRGGANVPQSLVIHLLEQCVGEKTVFIAC